MEVLVDLVMWASWFDASKPSNEGPTFMDHLNRYVEARCGVDESRLYEVRGKFGGKARGRWRDAQIRVMHNGEQIDPFDVKAGDALVANLEVSDVDQSAECWRLGRQLRSRIPVAKLALIRKSADQLRAAAREMGERQRKQLDGHQGYPQLGLDDMEVDAKDLASRVAAHNRMVAGLHMDNRNDTCDCGKEWCSRCKELAV